MHENGRAVFSVAGITLFNFADKEYRQAMINSGLLVGVIELPAGSLNFCGIKPYVLIFSHGNKEIKFLDASDATNIKAKRFNKVEIAADDIYQKYLAQNITKKTITELKDAETLLPSHFINVPLEKPANGVILGEVSEIFTGNQYTLGVFEKYGMLSTEKTGYRILTSSDINNGVVDWKSLQAIEYKDNKFDKYAVMKNDIVVTSKSSKVKTVVVDIEPKEKILVTGGMIIIRPNVSLINPTYLKIFLDSEDGQKTLKAIQKGATIITLNSKDLAKISVPFMPLEKQAKIAEKYNEKLTTLYALKQEVSKLEDGHYYKVCYTQGAGGLVYNKTMFEQNGWSVPTTYAELKALCKTIADAHLMTDNLEPIVPIVWSGADREYYWDYIVFEWWAQLGGEEAINNYKAFEQIIIKS